MNSPGTGPAGSTWAAFSGWSMFPTLVEPSVMLVRPYPSTGEVRPGDVVLFRPAEAPAGVVHRVLRVTPAGLVTRGDNNAQDDRELLDADRIVGKVVEAWSGPRRRRVAGGTRGLVRHRVLRLRPFVSRWARTLLRPVYRALGGAGCFPTLSPRVLAFRSGEARIWKALLGKHVVGVYDSRLRVWQVRLPYRLFVDDRSLPRPE